MEEWQWRPGTSLVAVSLEVGEKLHSQGEGMATGYILCSLCKGMPILNIDVYNAESLNTCTVLTAICKGSVHYLKHWVLKI